MNEMQQQPLQRQYITMNQQQYQQQYQNQYQQWYQQQQQNMLIAYNQQQSSSHQYLQRQMSNLKPTPFGAGINYSQGNHGLM